MAKELKMICLVDNHFGSFTINKLYKGTQHRGWYGGSYLIDNNGHYIKINLNDGTFISLKEFRDKKINKILKK